MNKVLNRFELIMLKVSRKLFKNHNEPFDIAVWLFCIVSRLLRRRSVRKLMITDAIETYAAKEVLANRRLKRKLYNDILYSALILGSTAEEYFWYKFETKKYFERRKFLTIFTRPFEFDQYMNEKEGTWIFQNKYKTYQNFKEYYRRSLILLESEENYKEFREFTQKHKVFVYKPYNQAHGIGIRLINISDYDSTESAFKALLKQGTFVLEERIIQSPDMAVLNSSSVNTIRVTTVLTKTGVHIMYPFIRIGKDNAFVDNGGAGGIIALVHVDTGIVYTIPQDIYGNQFIQHPDTKTQIVGFKVPRWQELIELAKRLPYVVPTVRYVGWDLALTSNGWVMIEGNNGGMLGGQQMLDQTGKKEAYYSLLNEI